MKNRHFVDPALVASRRVFRRFYHIASAEDVTLLDSLVTGREIVMSLINVPRATVPAARRSSLERACNAAEVSFMAARDGVRECPTFRRIPAGDRKHIAAILFELYSRGDRA
jgi:hypothetical protein